MSKPKTHLFWIAEYRNGQALPQFDPDTGEEHLFKEIDQSKLKRFGWYAFPPKLAQKVENAVVNPLLNSYVLSLSVGSQQSAVGGKLGTIDCRLKTNLVAYRTTTITFQPSTLSIDHHEADEYVLGLQGPVLGLVPRMHIFTDGRVELR